MSKSRSNDNNGEPRAKRGRMHYSEHRRGSFSTGRFASTRGYRRGYGGGGGGRFPVSGDAFRRADTFADNTFTSRQGNILGGNSYGGKWSNSYRGQVSNSYAGEGRNSYGGEGRNRFTGVGDGFKGDGGGSYRSDGSESYGGSQHVDSFSQGFCDGSHPGGLYKGESSDVGFGNRGSFMN